MEIFRKFTFDAAHHLPQGPEGHKCHVMHGHRYEVTLHVGGRVHPERGWVMDYADITAAFAPLMSMLDHHVLNDVEGLDNPTSENLAVWVWERCRPSLPGLAAVTVQETSHSGCVYRPAQN